MLASFLLAVREGIEAALILGIVFGLLQKSGETQYKRAVWWGAGAAVGLSIFAGISLQLVGASFSGTAEEVFEGSLMLIAAGILTWMIFWMKRQARQIKGNLEREIQQAVSDRRNRAFFTLAFAAILREGVELALFLTAAGMSSSRTEVLTGAVLGLGAAAVLGWLLYTTSIQLNLKWFFNVTGFLLLLFAAGLVAHGIHEFNEAGWIPEILAPIWNTNSIIHEDSGLGLTLKALFGYNGNPSLTEAAGYVLYLAAILLGIKTRPEQVVSEASAAG